MTNVQPNPMEVPIRDDIPEPPPSPSSHSTSPTANHEVPITNQTKPNIKTPRYPAI
eukprot:CAMPEP_0194398362 /NCGR_PEP_ID=MMETSP0174-20130528/126059_1 /TAXON_ID=216777 /ORGANISM="Proboscia alata, Strain PI-D3" /LENGTH=55 /DNA_ID=CAMNT_0039194645 /DNA_START=1406 /DNA_END=1573 /DNA_ORIENTATION=+